MFKCPFWSFFCHFKNFYLKLQSHKDLKKLKLSVCYRLIIKMNIIKLNVEGLMLVALNPRNSPTGWRIANDTTSHRTVICDYCNRIPALCLDIRHSINTVHMLYLSSSTSQLANSPWLLSKAKIATFKTKNKTMRLKFTAFHTPLNANALDFLTSNWFVPTAKADKLSHWASISLNNCTTWSVWYAVVFKDNRIRQTTL